MMVYCQNMVNTVKDFECIAQDRLSLLDKFCSENQLLGKVKADHFGLKCASSESYEKQRKLFEFESFFVYQSIISNRRISIIGLKNGIETSVGELHYLELSDQKQDYSQKEGIDHVEIVPSGCTYDELVGHLRAQGVPLKENIKPHHTTYDVVLPSGFVIKLSQEKLVDKIKREEMK